MIVLFLSIVLVCSKLTTAKILCTLLLFLLCNDFYAPYVLLCGGALTNNSILHLKVKCALTLQIGSFVQTIEDCEASHSISYIKLINVGQKVITRNCHGYLPSQVAFYLQNVHISPRKIYLSVNAEAINISDLVGGKRIVCLSFFYVEGQVGTCSLFFLLRSG